LSPAPADEDAVVLLHGFPEQPSIWDEIAASLSSAGYRTFAPRQRGYDPANRPTSRSGYRTELLVQDVLDLADREGLERFHLVGHDWGAILAWWLAARHPDRLLTMTSLTVPHPKAMREVALRSKQALQSYYVALFQLPWLPERVLLARDGALLRRTLERSGLSATHAAELTCAMVEPGALSAAISWYRGASAAQLVTLPDVTGVPVLYIWGSRDIALSRAAAEATATHVQSPYRFVPLEGASHWLPEEHSDLVLPPLLEHLSRSG
jgi:pimeloyl-ACP methyl ester carboxylesterase